MVQITFKPLSIFKRRKPVRRNKSLLRQLSSGLTKQRDFLLEESASSTQISENDSISESIHLRTKKGVQHNPHPFLSCENRSAFTDKLEEIRANSDICEIELQNFIERSTRQDIYLLRDLLDKDDRAWKSVRLEDTTDGRQFRRWSFKKSNIGHHIRSVCEGKNIELSFVGTCQANVDDMPAEGVVALLKEIKKDADIVKMSLDGHLNNDVQLRRVLKTLTNLVSNSDRTWVSVELRTGFGGEPCEYSSWKTVMEHYMSLFSHIYMQYNVPIDVMPCAVN